jgi:ribosomal protein S18 acetylase RimI-like enzyme
MSAIKCYKKLGFKKIAEQEDLEKILMIKKLLPVHTQN